MTGVAARYLAARSQDRGLNNGAPRNRTWRGVRPSAGSSRVARHAARAPKRRALESNQGPWGLHRFSRPGGHRRPLPSVVLAPGVEPGRDRSHGPLTPARLPFPPDEHEVTPEGVEPSRPCGHRVLSPARLPFRQGAVWSRWESNPHHPGFEAGASASWATGLQRRAWESNPAGASPYAVSNRFAHLAARPPCSDSPRPWARSWGAVAPPLVVG